MRRTQLLCYNLFRHVQVQRHGSAEESLLLADYTMPELQDFKTKLLGPDDLLIRNTFAGINYIDTYFRTGLYPPPNGSLPFTLGLEGVGSIVALGNRVKQSEMFGDALGKRGVFFRCKTGSYSSFSIVNKNDVFLVPDSIDDKTAAAGLLQGVTAHYLTESCTKLQPGDTVLVHAVAGGTGSAVAQLCAGKGVTVIGTCSEGKEAFARDVSKATHVITYNTADNNWVEMVRKIAPSGVKTVFDGVGKATFTGSMKSLKPRGDLISFGNASGAVDPVAPLELTKHGSISLQRPTMFDFVDGESGEAARRVDAIFSAIEKGTYKAQIKKVFPLTKVVEAHEMLESRGSVGKLLLDCQE